ncbi:MAG: hybrid sensor histidine kinase/response regulator [Deltaproteobacteria bacterium]|nr:hybrid sensor histidine kinase/response regulator [Deltaproteobacteria bacterium]
MAGQVARHKVMIVDDNPNVLLVLKELLLQNDLDLMVANNANEAISQLAKDTPDIIICDVLMPGIDGYHFHKIVSSSSKWCNIPFLFLTSLASRQDIRNGKEQGCDDYLTKPFDPDDLLSVVKGKLNLSKQRSSLNQTALDEFRRRIINTLSHEFRTPLVAINTGSELLLDSGNALDDVKTRRLIESISRGGQRLQRLVNDFMTLQQVDSGSAASAQKSLAKNHYLLDIARDAVDSFQESQERAASVIEMDERCDAENTSVLVYAIQIYDVIERLLSNAVKFGANSGPITVSVLCNASTASVVVRDRGPGMSNRVIEQACSGFSQIDRDTFEQQGCGLGLTIARYFTAINNGEILFSTPEGGGLEVEVKFPRVRTAESQ